MCVCVFASLVCIYYLMCVLCVVHVLRVSGVSSPPRPVAHIYLYPCALQRSAVSIILTPLYHTFIPDAVHCSAVSIACGNGAAVVGGPTTISCYGTPGGGVWSNGGVLGSCASLLPTFNASSLFMTVPEASPVGIVVGQLSALSASGSLLFNIVSGNSLGVFSLNLCSGIITLALPVLDYSNAAFNHFTFNVSASLPTAASVISYATLVINVTAVRQAPKCAFPSVAGTIPEIAPAGTTLKNVSSPGSALIVRATNRQNSPSIWNITYGDATNMFTLALQPGGQAVSLLLATPADGTSATLNYEARPSFTLTLTVTDPVQPSLFTQCGVSVALSNVNEPPFVSPLGQSFTISQAQAAGASAAAPVAVVPASGITTSDPDFGDTRNLTMTALFGGLVTLGYAPRLVPPYPIALSPSGVLTFIAPVVVPTPGANASQTAATYYATILVTDRAGAQSVVSACLCVRIFLVMAV